MLTIRQFSLWCTFIHACFQLVVVPIAVGMQCWQLVEEQPSKADATLSDRVWALREQLIHTTPTTLHMIISAFAASYYAMDFVTMWAGVHPLTLNAQLWFTVHHIFCFLGLTAPVFWAHNSFDTTIAFIGFWFGEVSNPPRCIVDLLQAEMEIANARLPDSARPLAHIELLGKRRSVRALYRRMDWLQHMHVVSFIIFRVVGCHYFLRIVWPYASLPVTNLTGGVTLLLSLMAVVVMLQGSKPSEAPFPGAAAIVEAQAMSGGDESSNRKKSRVKGDGSKKAN